MNTPKVRSQRGLFSKQLNSMQNSDELQSERLATTDHSANKYLLCLKIHMTRALVSKATRLIGEMNLALE